MVRRLRDAGLVDWEPGGHIEPTDDGWRTPSTSCAGTGSWRLFFTKWSASSWEIHDEAERMEHAVSERLVDRIDEMLGIRRLTRTAIRSSPSAQSATSSPTCST